MTDATDHDEHGLIIYMLPDGSVDADDCCGCEADATWTAVPMRWELVRAGDVVLSPTGEPWMTTWTRTRPSDGQVFVKYVRADLDERSAERNPTDTVRVLVPTETAASVQALRAGLGPVRVLDRA